jgi:hypothetical protein
MCFCSGGGRVFIGTQSKRGEVRLEGTWKETTVVDFEVLSGHLLAEAGEHYGKLSPAITQIQVGIITA